MLICDRHNCLMVSAQAPGREVWVQTLAKCSGTYVWYWVPVASSRLLKLDLNSSLTTQVKVLIATFSFQDLRCKKFLHQGTAFAHDVHICQFCSMRRGAFGDVFQFNKDSCFICGRFTPWKDDQRSAMVCHFHKPPPGLPSVKMCFLCRKPAYQNAVKCYLCPMCGNVGIKKCAMLVGD